MEKGQTAVVRVVALALHPKVDDTKPSYFILNIYESHDVTSSLTYKDGRLKAAIAHRIVDGLNDLDIGAADKLEVYLVKSADPPIEWK